jgi:hypothetical protein
MKAAVADMKSYLNLKSYRTIPIGYSVSDIAELRPALQNYLACSSFSSAIDFFGLNSYEWCGQATYQISEYSILQAMSEGYSIPIFFSETGCNVVLPRDFADQFVIFGPNMSDTWSGSIISEWVEEQNHYGIVNYPNRQIYSGAPIPIQPDFDSLKNAWSQVSPSGLAEAAYQPSFSAPACLAASRGWQVNGVCSSTFAFLSLVLTMRIGRPDSNTSLLIPITPPKISTDLSGSVSTSTVLSSTAITTNCR